MVRSLKRRLAQVTQLEIEIKEDVEVQVVKVDEEHHITMLFNGAARRGICHQNQGQCLCKGVHDCKVLGLVQDEKLTGYFLFGGAVWESNVF